MFSSLDTNLSSVFTVGISLSDALIEAAVQTTGQLSGKTFVGADVVKNRKSAVLLVHYNKESGGPESELLGSIPSCERRSHG